MIEQDFTNTLAVLKEFCEWFKAKYTENLEKSDRKTQERSLINSVRVYYEGGGGNAYEVKMSLLDYWKHVENGTPPHFPPLSAIKRWVEIKPVVPKPDARGKVPTTAQLAYLIARKISIVGTKGSYDLQTTKEEAMKVFKEKLEQALAKDCGTLLKGTIQM